MRKLEKIILLFNLFYYFKNFKNFNMFYRKQVKNKIFYMFFKINKIINLKKYKLFTYKKVIWFLNSFLQSEKLLKDSFYICIKLKFRVIVFSIYFKKKLLFSISRPFKKAVRKFKKLEKIYKKKNLLFGVKRKRIRKFRFKKLKKKVRIRKNRANYILYILNAVIKFISFFKVCNVIICVFKSNKYRKKFKNRKLYQKKKHKIFIVKLFKNLKKVLNLIFYANLKINVLLSNNFSHSNRFLKLKRKRS